MATKRSRRDDDDDDDRPRRRRDDDDDDDDDERPRSRRRRDDDEDDAERPRRRRRDEDDDDARPARRPRRKGRGPGTGKVLAIVGGVAAVIGVVVLVVFLARGGGASLSYAKFKEIKSSDTVEALEQRFGKAKKLEKSEWSAIKYADEDPGGFGGRGGRGAGGTLADLSGFGTGIEAWYHWHGGSEDIYVATGRRFDGKSGPVMKVYTNSNALRENERAGGDMNKMVPSFDARPVSQYAE